MMVMMGLIAQLRFPRIWPCWSIKQSTSLRKSHDESKPLFGVSVCLAWQLPALWKGRPCFGSCPLLPGLAWDLALERDSEALRMLLLTPHPGC